MNDDDMIFIATVIILWLIIYVVAVNYKNYEYIGEFINKINIKNLTKDKIKDDTEYYMIDKIIDDNVIDFFKTYSVNYRLASAMRVYRDKTWLNITYDDYYNNSIQVATALTKNCGKKCVVGLLGCNSPAWYYMYWGTIISEGVTIGIDTCESFNKIKHIINSTNINVLVIDDVEQLDKIKNLSKDEVKHLELIVTYTKLSDMDDVNGIHVVSFNDLITNVNGEEIGEFISTLDTTNINTTPATIICAHDNDNNDVKKIIITHKNIISTLTSLVKMINESDLHIEMEKERFISYLPLDNMTMQIFNIYLPIVMGGTVWFADRRSMMKKSLLKTIKRVEPTILIGTPQIWNNISDKVYDVTQNYGILSNYLKPFNKSKIKEQVGLNKCKYCITTKLLQDDTYDELNQVNIHVYNMCRNDETCGLMSLHLPRFDTKYLDKIGSCGKIIPKLKIKIDKDGEILTKGPQLFLEYKDDLDKTAKLIDKNGWYHTGYIGAIDVDDYLYITGHKDEYIVNMNDDVIYPKPIETKIIETLPFIENVIITNNNKNNLTALFTLKTKIKNDNVDNVINIVIGEINDMVPKPFNLKKWHILDNKFRVGKELTPNKKLRREYIQQKYVHLL